MNAPQLDELQEFHRFVGEKVTKGVTFLSPEDVLEEWRTIHPTSEEMEDDIAAVEEALDDLENGDQGIPLEEFDREIRARYNLRPRT